MLMEKDFILRFVIFVVREISNKLLRDRSRGKKKKKVNSLRIEINHTKESSGTEDKTLSKIRKVVVYK